MRAAVPAPPYALSTPTFEFPALAALAGRAPMGGEREVALACLVVARLVSGASGSAALTSDVRAARAAAAKVWLSSLALPAAIRTPCLKVAEASAAASGASLAALLAGVTAVTARMLDTNALLELKSVARALETGEVRPAAGASEVG